MTDEVANCEAGTVKAGERETVPLMERVAASEAGTVKTEDGDRVRETLRVRVMLPLPLRVRLTVAVPEKVCAEASRGQDIVMARSRRQRHICAMAKSR